jgi:formylglycine-generating enzyme required for sulfatase activity
MSIFISYRRSVSKHLARLIFQELRARGHDVFLDVSTIDSGAFDRIILNQIAARPHFLLILSPGALERCGNEGDWLRREIEEAFRLKRNIVPIFDEGFNIEQEKQFLPEPIRSELPRLNAPPYSHYYFDAFMDTICNRFLKQPVYDVPVVPTPTAEHAEVQRRIAHAASSNVDASSPPVKPTPKRLTSLDILLKPFSWIDIPAGKVTLKTEKGWTANYIPEGKTQTFDVPAFTIAKYPLTNAQFAPFIGAGGYTQDRWWTKAGIAARQQGIEWDWMVTDQPWTAPRLWQDSKWNGPDYPVVGVSWFEAVAFCLWLSEATGERIMLPTEQQWQRAAQGNTGRAYPWGDKFDSARCNSGVGIDWLKSSTSPVAKYEGKGDSPFGVVDMSGNVWEWCLTDYDSGTQDIDIDASKRVLRGGAWNDDDVLDVRADYRFWSSPVDLDGSGGFRLACSS